MANRSYIYSTDEIPGARPERIYSDATGISQWRWDVPLVYKLLASGNPRICRSIIWEDAGNIALVGDYDLGAARLEAFLERIDLPEAAPLVKEALAFIDQPRNRRRYVLLEAGEIFMMSDGSPTWHNQELLASVLNVEAEAEAALAALRGDPVEPATLHGRQGEPIGFIERWFDAVRAVPSPAPPGGVDPSALVQGLGLGHWCNSLYFDYRKPTGD